MHTIFIISLLLVIGLCGMIVLKLMEQIYRGAPNINIIRMFVICVTLQVMITCFLIMSFNKTRSQKGPKGPTGNRGNRGLQGKHAGINTCDRIIPRAIDKKFDILSREVRVVSKPHIDMNE